MNRRAFLKAATGAAVAIPAAKPAVMFWVYPPAPTLWFDYSKCVHGTATNYGSHGWIFNLDIEEIKRRMEADSGKINPSSPLL